MVPTMKLVGLCSRVVLPVTKPCYFRTSGYLAFGLLREVIAEWRRVKVKKNFIDLSFP